MTPERADRPESPGLFVEWCKAAFAANSARIEQLARQPETAVHQQPPTGGWSAAQCLEHAILTVELYLPHMHAALNQAFARQPKGLSPTTALGRGTLIGRLLLRALDPDRKKRMQLRAPKLFRPEGQVIDWEQLQQRTATAHAELVGIATAGDTIELNRIRLRTPISSWLRVSLAQALRIHAIHVARHLDQAERALAAVSN